MNFIMKLTLGICVLACALAVSSAATQYTNKFDNIDVDSVLNNPRVVSNYIKCLMDKGSCTAEGRELKKLLPDALVSDCSKCTPVQRKNAEKVIGVLRTKYSNDWNLLLAKYDPKGVYRARHGL